MISFKTKPYKLIINEDGVEHVIETVNANSVFVSIEFSDLQDELLDLNNKVNKNRDSLLEIRNKIEEIRSKSNNKENDEDLKEVSSLLEENKKLLKEAEHLASLIVKKTKEFLKKSIDYDKYKDIIFRIPPEKTEEFFAYLRLATLGIDSSEIGEKKTRDLIYYTINLK